MPFADAVAPHAVRVGTCVPAQDLPLLFGMRDGVDAAHELPLLHSPTMMAGAVPKRWGGKSRPPARCAAAGGSESPMLVTTKEMLLDAQKNHYAVGAFNVENLEFVMAVLAAAEETKSPVIMQTTSGTIKMTGLKLFSFSGSEARGRKA